MRTCDGKTIEARYRPAGKTIDNRRLRWFIGGISVALAIGCGKVPEGNASVTGKIRLRTGEPLTGVEGIVRFDPEELYAGGDRGASIGWLNADGSFEMMTHQPGDGVPVGDYRAVLVVRSVRDTPANLVHLDYQQFETTPWRVHVKANSDNHFEFTLDAAGERPSSDDVVPDLE